ncbi:MAG: fibronectin type III domain-containing protein [Clostridia bacterium]|nr:fibronectin type III domain-containing protein [Clostridia bacterium]
MKKILFTAVLLIICLSALSPFSVYAADEETSEAVTTTVLQEEEETTTPGEENKLDDGQISTEPSDTPEESTTVSSPEDENKPSSEDDKLPIVSLEGKTIFIIGNSHLYYGNCVLLGDTGSKDHGYLHNLILSNGENATVIDHTYPGRTLNYIYDNHLSKLSADALAQADFVVMSEAAKPNEDLVGTCKKIMALFPEDTQFLFSCHPIIYDYNIVSLINGIDQLRAMGMQIADWGKMIYDIYTGAVKVPNATLEFDRCSFIKDNLRYVQGDGTTADQTLGDSKHPNPLTGYLAAQTIYTALTNRSALYADYSYCGDTSVHKSFDFDAFIAKHYNAGKTTNFDKIFRSPQDMVGLQQLINQYNEAEGRHCIIELEGKDPTCTSAGLTKGYKCEICNKVFVPQEIVPSTGTHVPVYTNVIAPTCTTEGKSTGAHCSVCGKTLIKSKSSPALGHVYEEKITDKAHLVSAATYSEPAIYKYDCARCNSVSNNRTFYSGSKLALGVTSKITATQTLNSVTLTWNKVKNAAGYRIKLYDKSSGTWVKIADTKNLTYTIKELSAGKQYTFMVRAYIYEAEEKIFSDNYKEIGTATKPKNAKNITAKRTPTSVKLSWDKVSGATGYRVYRKVNGSWKRIATVTENTYKFTGLTAGKLYSFSVRPYIKTSSGNVLSAAGTRFTTATKPNAPTLKVTSPSKGAAKVTWTNVSNETGYQLYYSTSLLGKYTKVSSYSANKTSATVTGLKSGKTYYFKVRAYKKTDGGNVYSYFSTPQKIKIK